MKNVVANLYSEYGRFIDSQRAIPLSIDCLKPVERRILLSVHEVAKHKFQKSAKVVGHVLGNYHPHGDACLVGGTKLYSTTDNKLYSFEELIKNKIFKLPSIGYDEKNNKVINILIENIRITKKVKELYEIIFSDGSIIRCTNNHPFYSINYKSYIRADELLLDEFLHCINFNPNSFTFIETSSYIECINKINLDSEEYVYDFSVAKYENAFVVMDNKNYPNDIRLICAHNSAYDSLVGLVNRGLVLGQGEFGNLGLSDSPAAAMRYTEVKANPALESWIEDTLEFVPWESVELEPEPLFLPSPIPIGLIGDGFITGIGFNITRIPRYKYQDLLLRLIYLLDNSTEEVIIKPNIKDCIVKEVTAGNFNKILKTGEGEITIIPSMKQLNDSTLMILGRHPLVGFNKFKNFNLKHEETTDAQYFEAVDAWNYKSTSSVEIHVSPYRKKLSKDFIEQIINLISGKINIRVNIVENNVVELKGIDYCILQSYKNWKVSHLKRLETNLEKLKSNLREVNIIEIIKKYINSADVETIAVNVNTFNNKISKEEVIEICSKYRIKSLIEYKINKADLQTKISEFSNNIANIDKYTFELIKAKL